MANNYCVEEVDERGGGGGGFSEYDCQHCSEFFSNFWELGQHVRLFHRDLPRPFACSKCGDTFQTDSTRAAHQSRHKNNDILAADRGGLGFNCKFCPKGFDKFQKLAAHVRHIHFKETGKLHPQHYLGGSGGGGISGT